MHKISEKDYNDIINNKEVIEAAGFTGIRYSYSLGEVKRFMDKDIPIKFYK